MDLANTYLRHLVSGTELPDAELAEAEKAYVLWDWVGLASLAYEQYLAQGRGAFVGPRTTTHEESVTVAFDYVPAQEIPPLSEPRADASLRTYLDHYHPDFDLVVVWRRRDGSLRHELLRYKESQGLLCPRDLYLYSRGPELPRATLDRIN